MARKVTTLIKNMKKNGYTEPDVADDWEDRFEYDYKGSTVEDSNARMEQLKENANASYAAYKATKAQTEADKATGLYQYNNATDDQKSALENAYTTQRSDSADNFKSTYGVSDDDYNTLMNGYKTYRKQQAASANESYSSLSTEQKTALNKINQLQSELSNLQKYNSYNVGTIDLVNTNDIAAKTKELNSLKSKFKSDYGVDDTTYSTWLALQGNEKTEREAEASAHSQGKRTQSQELEYASKSFQNAANKSTKATGSKVDSQTMKDEIFNYIEDRDTKANEANHSTSISNYSESVEKNKTAIKNKYGLSNDEFEDLLYYGQELYDAQSRKKQQQDAYNKVHNDDVIKNAQSAYESVAGTKSGELLNSINEYNSASSSKKTSLASTIKQEYSLSDEGFDYLVNQSQYLTDEYKKKATAKNISGGIQNSIVALATNLGGGVGGLVETGKYLTGAGYKDKQSAMNVNGAMFGASNTTSDYQGATQNALTDWNPVAGFLYGAGMSAAESAETSVLGGLGATKVAATALSLAPFAANAYTNSLSENVSNDQSMRKALTGALQDASIETLTEIASADKFWDMAKSGNSKLRNKIVDWLVEAGIEGTEEVAGNIADRFMDSLKGSSSDYNKTVRNYIADGMSENEAKNQATKDQISEDVESFMSGAVSGGISGGIALGINAATNAGNANNLFDNYTKEDYAEWADSLETNPSNYENASAAQSAQKAKELATKMSQEETPSKKEKTQLYEYYQDIVDIEKETATKKQDEIKQQRVVDKIADKIDSGINKVASVFGKEYNTESASTQQTTTENQTTEQTTGSVQESSSGASSYTPAETHTTYNDAYKAIQSATTQEELNDAVQDAKASTEISDEDYARLRETAGSYAASRNNLNIEAAEISAEDAYNEGYQNPNAENPYTGINNKNAIAFNEAQQRSKEDQKVRDAEETKAVAEKANLQLNALTRDFMNSHYNTSMNSGVYSTAIESALTAGRTGADINEVVLSNPGVSIVGEDLVRQAYSIGAQAAAEEMIFEGENSAKMTDGVKFGTGTFSDQRSNKDTAITGLSTVKAIAQATGLNIVLTDNPKLVAENENGSYVPSESTIYINADRAGQLAGTVYHEVGEFTSTWNQKEQAGVVNAILTAAQKELGASKFAEVRNLYASKYKAVEKEKTDIDLDKEMANDLLFKFLGSEEGMTKLMDEIDKANGYEEAKSIKQKLVNWLKNLADHIRNFLANFEPTDYQRRIAEANLDNMEQITDALTKSIANATRNYNEAKAKAERQSLKDGNGSIEDYGTEMPNGEKKLSITTYEDGGRAYLKKYLDEMADDLTDKQKQDVMDHLDWAYKLAKDLSKDESYRFFSMWSQSNLIKGVDGVPLIETIDANSGKPIQSVAVNNGEYPLNLDFSQVCKKRSTLNAVLNYLIDEYGFNLPMLTETDLNTINTKIKEHGFEIACGLCFVDAKRYRAGKWASSFADGVYTKDGKLKSDRPGYNNLVRLITAKDKTADIGYAYFNFATDISDISEKTIDQLDDSELDFSKLIKKMGKFAQKDENGNVTGLKGYKDNNGKTKNPTAVAKMAYAIYSNPSMRKLVAKEDLEASEGLDNMRAQNSTLYALVNAHWGAGKPKLPHGATAYGNEILRSANWGSQNDFNAEAAYKVGGVRVQSFSDYEANMFFDYMQMFADMTARALPSHAYTKEATYARLFGMTGQKINLSVVAKAAELTPEQQERYNKLLWKGKDKLLEDPEFKEIAEHAGLGKDENGNWTRLLVEDETFPLEEAKKIQSDPRYSSNCGIIWIGVSHDQIMMLLDSEDVPMVIPYHSSGVSMFIKKARNLLLYTDYTNQQNTRKKSDGKKISGKDFDFYGSLARTNDPKTTADEYKAWCEENGYLPKFDEFADHPNYYKLLVDFRVYDYNGIDPEKVANRKYLPQGAVSMTFPEQTEFKQLVKDSLADQQKTKDKLLDELSTEQGSLITDIKDAIGLDENGGRTAGENIRRSVNVDTDGNALTPAQQEYFSDSKVRDEDDRLKVMYHGTQTGGFTVFDVGKSKGSNLYGRGIYFSDSKSMAGDYGDTYEVYLNVKNPIQSGNKTITKDQLRKLVDEIAENEDYGIENYGYGATVDSIVKSVWGKDDFQMLQDLNATCVGDFVETVKMFNDLNDTDYDGIIDDTQTVVWNPNQIKSVDNQNPTDDVDIRRAVGFDEFDFEQFGDPLLNNLTEDELREWVATGGEQETETNGTTDLVSALRSSNEVLKGGKVNKADIRKIARQIKSQYGSNINVDTLAENLAKIFDYAQSRDYINYEDLATVITEVAAPVIDGSVNKVGAEEFDSFKNTLKGYTFKLDERQENEVIRAFGSWGAFRKQLPGVKFVRGETNGVALDSVWDSLCQESGYVLGNMVTSNDMPLVLVDAYNSMRPTYQNAFGEDAQRATQDAAMEIVSKYYQYAADQEKTELKNEQRQRLLDQSNMLKKQNEETRKKLQQEYKERLDNEVAKLKQEGKTEKVSVQVARLRARNARTVASLRESQKRKEQLRTLNKNAAKLVEWVSNPTDKNHIPKMMQTPVLELVAAMDFVPQTVRETADGKYSIRLLESRHVNEDGSYSYTWKTITADTVQEAVAAYKKAMSDFGLGSASNRTWQERMQTIQDLYQQNEEDDWFEKSELKQGLDKNLGEQLGDILRNNRGMLSIAELSSDELQTINDVVRNVMHSVNQMNRMYSQPSQKVTDVAHEVMDRAYQQKAKGRKAHDKLGNIFLDTFTLDHATPETFFHGLFGGNETDPITKTMIKAQNQKARDIRQAQEYMEEYMTKDVKKVVKDWMYSKTGDHNTRNFYGMELTTTQVMSLYELMKRPDAQQHKVGGFMVDETGRKTDGRHKVVHLTDEQITNITDTLSEEQKRIADAMQYYMAHQCAEQGNETAMQLYGYEKYLDEHYFPMATDKNTIATKDSNVTTGAVNAIKNSDFTKKITPNASNPLILKDIFTVFSDHVSDMATYHSWAAPLQDILRFYNYNEKTNVDNGDQTFIERRSTKDAFDYFYGENGQQYMTRLLSSINQMEKSNFVGGKFMEMMTGNAKAAAVMGNIRVVVQQPTAFFRAGEMISYKYLNDGLAGKYAKEAAELRDRTSDVFWLKNQGNIDGYITQGMVSTITGVQTAKEKINEKAGYLAGKADEITWAAMYRAVYTEQVDKLGKNKVGTEEFENAVNDRFSEIMLRTQVYDGTITRSQFMRSTDKYNTLASAFMAEPVKTYNIVLRHMIDLAQADTKTQLNAAKKGLVKAAGVLTLTNAANAVAQSLWDAFRNAGDADDGDKDFLQRFLDALGLGFLMDEDTDAVSAIMGGNFIDNMDLLSNIPLVADYWDAVKSGIKSLSGGSTYSSDSDLPMSAVNNFFKAVKAIVNPSEKMTTYGRFAAVARGFSDMTGIPLYAVQRDVVAFYNTIAKDIANGLTGADLPVLQKTSKYTKAQQAKQDVYEGVITDVYENAVNSGDYKESIENAVEQGSSYESIKQSLKSNTQDIYIRLLKTDPSEATKMKNRLAQMYTYLDEKTDVRKDKTEAEKLEYHKGKIDEWKADWEEKQAEEQK